MTYRVHVRVMPRAGLLDPAGPGGGACPRRARIPEAPQRCTWARPSRSMSRPRPRGRGRGAGPRDVRPAARQSGHRGLPRSRWRRPDAARRPWSVSRAATAKARRCAPSSARGAEAYFVWHRDTDLKGADVVILPGGFSYGDYLRSGAIARFSPIMEAVQAPRRGRRRRASASATASRSSARPGSCPARWSGTAGCTSCRKPVDVRIERTDTLFTRPTDAGESSGSRWRTARTIRRRSPTSSARSRTEGQVVLRYAGRAGCSTPGNPNGGDQRHRRHLQRRRHRRRA